MIIISSGVSFAQDVLMQQKAARLYQTGTQLMDQKQYAAALENFNQYLSFNPISSSRQDAEYYRAICALNLYHADAEKRIQDFANRYPTNPKASLANTELANFFYNEKNYKKAANYFAKADFNSLTPSEQNSAHFRWGYSLFSQKVLKDALDQFNFVKTQGSQYGPASSYYAGFVEYSQADYVNALTDLKRAEQAEAYATIVPYLIANVYYRTRKIYDNLLAYGKSVSSKPDLTNADEIALMTSRGIL
ncbi:MAG: tetratricopeptide repeat protein [Cyclobacteriaceae bacterium]